MRVVGLWATFAAGLLTGAVIGVVAIFWISLVRKKRAVHADGVVCSARVTGTGFLDGDAVVRFSGAFEGEAGAHDILGLALRIADEQDLVFGTFNSFRTAKQDKANTDAGDYLANRYSSVTPWLTPGRGPVVYHLEPPPPGARGRGTDRLSRLDADLAAKTATFRILADDHPIGSLHLDTRVDDATDAAALRMSMFRCGRGVRPVGFRNGIRGTVYPISELARRIRGH